MTTSADDVRGVELQAIPVAALEDLIAMQCTTGRSQDVAKLIELEDLARLAASSAS